jgi:hypothetical protein
MDFIGISDLDLQDELLRRKQVLESDTKGLSVIPLEFLISEYEKRKFNNISNLNSKMKELEDSDSIDEEYIILFNAIKTPDGTVLSSTHRHDFVAHKDEITNKVYGVDGGSEYFKRIGDFYDCEDLSITNKTAFEEIRSRFHWGSYGVNSGGPLVMKRVSELSNSHIVAIIENVFKDKRSVFKSWFDLELLYREEHDINIEN